MPAARPGRPEPLGATLADGGVNVAVCSAHAEAIEFCLFDDAGVTEIARVALPARTGDVWHGFVPGIAAGARYGLRAHGPWSPHAGHRFNPAKLLVDPYALALDRRFALHPSMLPPDATSRDDVDSAPFVPKGVVGAAATAASDTRPRVPWADTIVYEMHVRGFTHAHPRIPADLRGTFAGLAHPVAVAHLRRLGVTAVELMPIAAAIDEPHLVRAGLTNYWGYNPIALFVPDPRLAPGGIGEVRDCVQALHAAGIEVVLDVVLNHTGEGDPRGPTLSLPRPRQRDVLPDAAGRRRALPRRRRLRQHARPRASVSAAPRSRRAPLLRAHDRRGRVSLRSRHPRWRAAATASIPPRRCCWRPPRIRCCAS